MQYILSHANLNRHTTSKQQLPKNFYNVSKHMQDILSHVHAHDPLRCTQIGSYKNLSINMVSQYM